MNTTHLITTMAVAGSSHGSVSGGNPKELIAIWISLNLICLIIFTVRWVMWLMSDRKETLVNYLFWETFETGVRFALNLQTMFFLALNGLALLGVVIAFVTQLL